MRDKDLYAQILGIKSPWQVSSVELSPTKSEVTVRVEQEAGTILCCPTCGQASPGYDSRTRRWRHLDTCQYKTIKVHLLAPDVPGAGAPVFNLLRDPREEHPHAGLALWSGASFQDMVKRHQMMIAKYPHQSLDKGRPYGGIENLRPESKEIVENFMSWH